MYKIEKGKRVFSNQSKNEKEGCNIQLLKKHEMNNSIFPEGWCMEVDPATKNRWIKEKKAKHYPTTIESKILDVQGKNFKIDKNE